MCDYLVEYGVVDLEYIPYADSRDCDCDNGMSRWVDPDGRKWCEKCVQRMEDPWREVFPK